ncbi:Trans-aconitate 2-methyltransferase [Methanimicrococcus sp. At1]|uniref:Trans-aconitate 2-methyltransferase n=1 Tax=Methanimicrococcus hacksteinii TaxID=3028293 RepID=A0ABU3VQX4_9EURY|nr:methyltransferase domain-containing protein [Methanimicrococcus sp. At1]MDV0445812.1 Trans-aconitate 2-methyltransferase [Methanimicrococcus sp. At1]
MKWDAGQYLKFEKERTQPSADLISRLFVPDPKKILDIGCGPGNSTKLLKNKYPNAEILGIDKSFEMIETAKKTHPDIEFKVADAVTDLKQIGSRYDIIFSNAAIQWMPNHEKLLPEMMALLNSGGILAVQTPLVYEAPMYKIIQNLISEPEWKNKFISPRVFYNLEPGRYYDLFSKTSTEFTMWETVYYHIMDSYEEIVEWYKGSGLRPYLEQLTAEDGEKFESEIRLQMERYYSKQEDGKILMRFPRLFFTVKSEDRK